jgi:hypothetical protein
MTTINTIRCADCGEFLSLNGQTVSCARCIRRGSPTATGSLAQTILAIETQASETGHSLDVGSLKADGRGRLTFSVKKLVDTTVGGKAASRTPVKRLA